MSVGNAPARKRQSERPPLPGRQPVSPSPSPPPVPPSVQESSQQRTGPQASPYKPLLVLEDALREPTTTKALAHALVNESRKLMRARQAFVVRLSRKAKPRLRYASGISSIDANAPAVRKMEASLTRLMHNRDPAQAATLALETHNPSQQALWLPLTTRDNDVFAALVVLRPSNWAEGDVVIGRRIAATAAHAWLALDHRVARPARTWGVRWAAGLLTLGALAALAIPVPMSALAPCEIVPREPHVVTAPIEGVVKKVRIAPNDPITRGQPLIEFERTNLENGFAVADRELRVAEAKVKRANQEAFSTRDGRRELAVARAERDVKAAERSYARELLNQSEVRAPVAGLAVFNDRKDLIGRPVKIGERLMEIADTNRFWFRIEMPVADVALLKPGAEVKVFLDANPLYPLSARLVRADYQAKPHQGGRVAFRAWAEPSATLKATPRLGGRGTAQVFGQTVPLGLYLFRRPIAKARQWLGL